MRGISATTHKQLYLWIAVGLALALPWGIDSFGAVPAYMLNISAIISIVAVSLNLLVGFSGQVSLAHAAFIMIGEYCSALLTLKLGFSFWLALPATALLVGVVGFLIGLPAVRLTGNFLAVATLGFGLAIPEIALKWKSLTHGSSGLMPVRPRIGNIGLNSDLSYYYLILLCLGIVLWVCVSLLHSKTGRAFQAIRDSEIAAVSAGINIGYYKALVFALSAAFTGVAGSLYAHYLNYVSPNDFTLQDSFLLLAMVVIGGLASLPGSILGAVVLTITNQISTGFAQFSAIFIGIIMVVVVLFFPHGLISLFRLETWKKSRGSIQQVKYAAAPKEAGSSDVS